MHLGRTGEAFFLRQTEDGALFASSSTEQTQEHWTAACSCTSVSILHAMRLQRRLAVDMIARTLSDMRSGRIAGDEGANSGSSAPADADAAPGAAIEHVVAAQEAAQALEGLESIEVRKARVCHWPLRSG